MRDKGNKGTSLILFILFFIAVLLLFINNITRGDNGIYTYSDPVISKKNIRGTIYDRHGLILAFDSSGAGFRITDDSKPQECAAVISEYTHFSPVVISSLIEGGTAFIPIGKDNTTPLDEIENLIREHGLSSELSLSSSYYRTYPYSSIDFLLGKSFNSHSAEGGIEEYCNSYLSSVPTPDMEKTKGEDIVLTIDINMEEILFSLLEENSYPGNAAILNSRGEILAYYGSVTPDILSAICYSHSTESETSLFIRENPILIKDCTPLSQYYIYLSSDKENTLPLIERALIENLKL